MQKAKIQAKNKKFYILICHFDFLIFYFDFS